MKNWGQLLPPRSALKSPPLAFKPLTLFNPGPKAVSEPLVEWGLAARARLMMGHRAPLMQGL